MQVDQTVQRVGRYDCLETNGNQPENGFECRYQMSLLFALSTFSGVSLHWQSCILCVCVCVRPCDWCLLATVLTHDCNVVDSSLATIVCRAVAPVLHSASVSRPCLAPAAGPKATRGGFHAAQLSHLSCKWPPRVSAAQILNPLFRQADCWWLSSHAAFFCTREQSGCFLHCADDPLGHWLSDCSPKCKAAAGRTQKTENLCRESAPSARMQILVCMSACTCTLRSTAGANCMALCLRRALRVWALKEGGMLKRRRA